MRIKATNIIPINIQLNKLINIMNNKLFSEQLRQIKIDVNDNHQKFAVFERFSDFAPFVAEHYGSDKKMG